MSTFNIIYLGGIIFLFVVFAVLFSWDEYRTRHVPH
jgi:hypothetical protein